MRVYALRREALFKPPAPAAASAESAWQTAGVPRLSIVVLPFANLSNDPEQGYFADGITDDLTTDLSRLAPMWVISRNTAFTYRNKSVDTKQIDRELGVRYVLEGSVHRIGNRIRVNAQLIDAQQTRISGQSDSTATPVICSRCKMRSPAASRARSTLN